MKTAHEALMAAQHVLHQTEYTEAHALALATHILAVGEQFAEQMDADVVATYAKSAKALGLTDYATPAAAHYFRREIRSLVNNFVTSLALHMYSRDFLEKGGAA